MQSLSQKIARNTIFNVAGRLWGIGITFFITPYIISHLGAERFGLWAITGVVTGYFGLLDFGIGASFVKYIAEFYAQDDYYKINQLVNSGVVFYSLFAALIIGLMAALLPSLLVFLKIPSYLYSEAKFIFLAAVSLLAVSNAFSPIGALQTGLQRMDISNKITMALSIPYIIGVVFFMENGFGLRGLLINNAIIFMLNSILNLAAAFRVFPQLRFKPFMSSKEVFKKLFFFGGKLQIARISSLISTHMDKLIVNRFLSLSQVVFYQLGSSIIEAMKSLALLLPSAIMPAFSELDAKKERKRLVDGYVRSSRYLILAVTPLFTFSFVCAAQFMIIWMGKGYEKAAVIVQILSVGWGLAVMSSMRSAIVQAIGKPEIEMQAGLLAAAFNIPLSIVFVIKFGFLGAALGTSISLILSVIYGYIKLHKEIQLNFWIFAKEEILPAVVLCVGVATAVGIFTRLFCAIIPDYGRITAFFIFIVQAVLFFGIYLKALSCLKPLHKGDISALSGRRWFLLRQLLTKLSR